MFEFTRSFLEALAIVLGVSFVSLGWRSGIVVATSVPLVLAIVFVVMAFIGLDLQRVTLGALIIALGLLVDDAIIAVEMIVVKLEQGWERERAASFAWTSTAFPMLTGTLVTAAGFMPIGLAASAVGEYAGGIFWVVGIALVASWFVAVLFTPFLGYKLLPSQVRGGHLRDEGAIYSTRFYRAFRRALEFCVARPLVVIVAAVLAARPRPQPVQQGSAAVLSAVRTAGIVLRDAPGRGKRDSGDAEGPPPKRSACSRATRTSPPTRPTSARVRRASGSACMPVQPNESFAQIVVVANDVEARERVKARIEARGRRRRLERGAGARRSFQFRPAGRLPRAVPRRWAGGRKSARNRRARSRRHARGSARRRRSSQLGRKMPSLRLDVDQARARALGLTPQDIAQTLQTLVGGVTVTTIRAGEERIDVVARAIPSERAALDRIEDLTIVARGGVAVPVGQVAHVVRTTEEPIIWRKDRELVVTALADVANGAQPPDVSRALWEKLASMRESLPPAYRIEMGGAIEESQKGDSSIFALFPLMIIAMLTLLMLQLQSFSRLAIVFFTAPLGIVGASIALNLAASPVRLRRPARPHRARRHGHAQHRHPRRSDRDGRARARALPRRSDRVLDDAPRPARRADGARRDPGDDPAVAKRLLGPDGLYDHGRAVLCDVHHAVPAALDLCAVVQKIVGRRNAEDRRRAEPSRKFIARPGLSGGMKGSPGGSSMILDWALASLHHLAILTLAAILAFELALTAGATNASAIARLARVDAWYGVTAALALAAGVARVVFGLKGAGFYLGNTFFWTKMALFAAVAAISVAPTLRYIVWRRRLRLDSSFRPDAAAVRAVRLALWAEAALFAATALAAAAMARGFGT